MVKNLAKYIPGIALMFVVGYAGKIVANYVPHSEYVLFAIAIGMLVRNIFPLPKIFAPGIASYELWMKTGVAVHGLLQRRLHTLGLLTKAVPLQHCVSDVNCTYPFSCGK